MGVVCPPKEQPVITRDSAVNGDPSAYTNQLNHTINYMVDDADKLTSISEGGTTIKSYGYDAAGRTTSVTTSAGTTTLSYDYESRLTQITYPNSTTNTFSYNGLSARVSKTDSAGTRTYRRDGASVIAPVYGDGQAWYHPANLGERRSSTPRWFHAGLKNDDAQSDSTQALQATKTYDAFGNPDVSSGTWTSPFGYGGAYGYQSDADSNLVLLGYRYYDTNTGRFLTRDPIRIGSNWFLYCDGNPLNACDELGLQKNKLPITGFSRHALNRMIARDGGTGVSNKAILDAFRHGTRLLQKDGTLKIVGKDAVVVVSKEGKVVTLWPQSSRGWRNPGSGGSVGNLLTILIGVDALTKGLHKAIKYRKRYQGHIDAIYDYEGDDSHFYEHEGVERP